MMKSLSPNLRIILPALLSGILTGIAWQSDYLFWLLLLSYIPLFEAVRQIRNKKGKFGKNWLSLLMAVALFQYGLGSIATFWLIKVSPGMWFIAGIMESLFLTLTLTPILYKKLPLFTLIPLLVLYEWVMQENVMLTPYWLAGYGWGNRIEIIQYFSVIGLEGGSALIYLVNWSLFTVLQKKRIKILEWAVFVAFGGLTLFSLWKFYFTKPMENDPKLNIALVNTNINSGEPDFVAHPEILVKEIDRITPDNSLVVLSEGFFNSLSWIQDLKINPTIHELDSIGEKRNQVFLIGANIFSATRTPSPQSRFFEQRGIYYNVHNVGMLLDKNIRITSKQVFIPFQEYVPDNFIAQWINQMIPIVGSDFKFEPLDRNDPFTYKNKPFDILLCYGSLFPLRGVEKAKGNQFLAILANESWNNSEQCARQYLNMNRVLSILTGLPVYRSSNGGYSAFVRPNGADQILHSPQEKFSLLKAPLPRGGHASFYTHFAGYTYWLALLGVILLLLSTIWNPFSKEGKVLKDQKS